MCLATLALTTDRAFFIKCGSTYTTKTIVSSRQRWASYGTGDKPIFNLPSSGVTEFIFGRTITATAFEDFVVSGFDFRTDAPTIQPVYFFSHTQRLENIYIDGCDASNTNGASALFIWGLKSGANVSSKCGLYGCSISTNLTPWLSANGGGYSFGASLWNFIVATYFEGAGGYMDGVSPFTHHIYVQCKEHSCYLLLDFGLGTGKRNCINQNWDGDYVASTPWMENARWHAISYCNMRGTSHGFDFGSGASYDTEYTEVIAHDCTVHNTVAGGWFFDSGKEVTIRDLNCWGFANPSTGSGPADELSLRVYRLKWYYNSGTASSGSQIGLLGSSWTQPIQYVDNIMVDMRSSSPSANMLNLDVALHLSNGSLIDRNQWYAPNDANAILGAIGNNSATVTFAQWKAFGVDLNGSYGNPNWNDPADGDFS